MSMVSNGPGTVWIKLALILIGLYLIIAFWLVYSGNPLVFLLGESVFLASLLYWLFVMLPNTKYKNKYKSNFSKTNAPIRKFRYTKVIFMFII